MPKDNKKAVVESLKEDYGISWFEETGPVHQIQFSIMKNEVTIMLDTTGRGLHKRGYRPEANDAPIRETLAAALCSLSRLRHYHTMYDPCCGSGTILIEGAMMAHNIAPELTVILSATAGDLFLKRLGYRRESVATILLKPIRILLLSARILIFTLLSLLWQMQRGLKSINS